MARLVPAFLLGAVCAALVTWLLMGGKGGPGEGKVDRDAAASATGDAAARLGTESAETPASLEGTEQATERLLTLERENTELRARVEALAQELQAGAAEAETPTADPMAFRFGVPAEAPTFDKAEWGSLAEHLRELRKAMPELRDDIVEGRMPGQKVLGAVQEHNTPLALFAMAVSPDLGDPSPNGAYTHPAVLANLIRAALLQAGDPLTEGQETEISAFGKMYVAEVERLAASLTESAPMLARTVGDVDAKLKFLDAVKSVLSPGQREILFDPETEGRVGLDLLSPALVYGLRIPVHATDRKQMESKLAVEVFNQAGIEVQDPEPYAWVVRQWVDDLPGLFEIKLTDRLDLVFPHIDGLQRDAHAQVKATERILAMGRLTEEESEALRALLTVIRPTYVQPEPGGASGD